ncbi:hypothetical protein ACHAXH_009880 [Discostella pseudostelligera]
MTSPPPSESFGFSNDNDEIAAFAALVRSSSLPATDDDHDHDGDAASLVSMDDERLRRLLVPHDDDDDDDDGTIASLDTSHRDGGDWRHTSADDEHVVHVNNDSGGGGASISASAVKNDDNEDENEDSSFLLSPTSVRQHAHSLLLSNNSNDNDNITNSIPSRRLLLHFILHKLQTNPILSIATFFMGALTVCIWVISSSSSSNNRFSVSKSSNSCDERHRSYTAFPAEVLLGITIPDEKNRVHNKSDQPQNSVVVDPPYSLSDFQLRLGQNNSLTYWDEIVESIEQTQHLNYASSADRLWTNLTTWGPCYPRSITQHHHNHQRSNNNDDDDRHQYLRINRTKRLAHNWTYIVQTSSHDENIIYPTERISDQCTSSSKRRQEPPLGGLCRPSFLIIGQGKCGTSSLYHYLTGHPRILPAKEKQIDYFNYHKAMPLSWYYSNFPTIESFLGRGALMTGEASPGYMPYPYVVEAVVQQFSSNWKHSAANDDGRKGLEEWKAIVRSLPKIIAIVRNPIDRAKSSYKYNYVDPAITKLRSGSGITVQGKRIPGKKSDAYYRSNHLFSFQELAYAELIVLKECLMSGGSGERWTYEEFGKRPAAFFYESVRRRCNSTSTSDNITPPLIYLDEACYTATKSKAVPRTQWKDLATEHPNKTLTLPNLHLVQSILGRGVYTFPLEWWYEVFSHGAYRYFDHIHIVCTEEMANTPESTMENVTNFLGLPEFDFTNVTNVGRYNVGGHRGYDTITKLHPDDDENHGASMSEDPLLSHDESLSGTTEEDEDDPLLAISDAFLNELIHFYQPFNERLFQLIGKRCPW